MSEWLKDSSSKGLVGTLSLASLSSVKSAGSLPFPRKVSGKSSVTSGCTAFLEDRTELSGLLAWAAAGTGSLDSKDRLGESKRSSLLRLDRGAGLARLDRAERLRRVLPMDLLW